MSRITLRKLAFAAAWCPLLAPTAGCHSYHIDTTIENRSGSAVQLLEVDYPSASFGVDAIAADADFHYRFDVLGSGPITIQYTGANRQAVKKTGPTLYERQEGRMQIMLLPGGRVEFHSELTPHS
ncbi:MAG TPA: hypothetical protein VMD55_00625 [Terracidiphilus sp.]|nr:hypothetical protein [Terracidiphilus sp.]